MNSTADSNDSDNPSGKSTSSLLTWLQLMRLPTVFTALSNILCGFLITHHLKVHDLLHQTSLWLLLASTIGLYLGGMVLNDVFDSALDAVERPERPIPSGRISRRAAGIFGTLLMAGGVAAAATTGIPSLVIALLIVPSVLLYNGFLKTTFAAPLGMATCRFLNLMLGASAVPNVASLWQTTPLAVAAALSIYVLGVTVFARNEAGRSSRWSLMLGTTLVVCGIALNAWLIKTSGASVPAIATGRMALLLLALNLLMRAAAAISNPAPRRIQKTVGLMLLCIIFLDAIVVFAMTGDSRLALLVIMLVAPASLLRRVIPMS